MQDYIPQNDTNGDGIIDGAETPLRTLTEEEQQAIFTKDLEVHLKRARRDVPNLEQLDSRAKEAVVDMSFNLGSLAEFNDLRNALPQKEYGLAAWDVGHRNRTTTAPSLYSQQVPNRAARNIALLEAAAIDEGQQVHVTPPDAGD